MNDTALTIGLNDKIKELEAAKQAEQPPAPADLEGLRELYEECQKSPPEIEARKMVEAPWMFLGKLYDSFPTILSELTTARQRSEWLEQRLSAQQVDEEKYKSLQDDLEAARQRIGELEAEVQHERKLEEIAAATAAANLRVITSQSAEIELLRKFVKRVIPVLAEADGIIGNLQKDTIPKTSKLTKSCRDHILPVLQAAHDLLTQPPQEEEVRKTPQLLSTFNLDDFERRLNRAHPHEVLFEVERKTLNTLIHLAKKGMASPAAPSTSEAEGGGK